MKNKLKYKFLSAIIIGTIVLPTCIYLIIPSALAQENSFQNISVQEAYRMIRKEKKKENLVILDVRDTTEFNLGHLYDSILIPLNELEARISELEDYKTSKIIIYCKSGYRSHQASEILVEYGFTKIYNMLGGILAWMDVGYPIWTTSHYVMIDRFHQQIEPLLLHNMGCASCTENQECPSDGEFTNVISEVLEQDDDHTTIFNSYEFDNTTYEQIVTTTFLWRYNEFTDEINRTGYFNSVEITTEDKYTQFYSLIYLVQHEEFTLTISTFLTSLNSEIYNTSFTNIVYIPANEKSISSKEFVEFDSSVTLSQHYKLLGKVANKMAKIYKVSGYKSGDENFAELSRAYNTMKEEIKTLSKLVKKELPEYDRQILQGIAILMDPPWWVCAAAAFTCGFFIGYIVSCAIAAAVTAGVAFAACVSSVAAAVGIAYTLVMSCTITCCCMGYTICC